VTPAFADAERPRPAPAPRPWGRLGVRATAFLYLGVMIALPLVALLERGLHGGPAAFWREVSAPIAREALFLTLGASFTMTVINVVMGTLTAYVLVRYRFPGRRLFEAAIDVPFAIPTLVIGLMLVVLYGPQSFVGAWLGERGVEVIFAKPGIVLALLLVCYPFVVRTVEPVLAEIEKLQEEAAWTLGASRWTTFRRVVLPAITPALVTGALLAFGRALGEFGSIVVVAGNIPRKTLTAPTYIYGEIESQNERGASAVSLVLLALSFALLLGLDWIQRRRSEPRG
jgi:sulfate/thiosulfate transport system permease protein